MPKLILVVLAHSFGTRFRKKNKTMKPIILLCATFIFIGIAGCCGLERCPESETCTSQTLPDGVLQLQLDNITTSSPDWCGVACGEMIFKYYDYPNVNKESKYQCGILGLMAGIGSICHNDCSECAVKEYPYFDIDSMLRSYPALVKKYFEPQVQLLDFKHQNSALTFDSIKYYINNSSPVLAIVSLTSTDGKFVYPHSTVIHGYMSDITGNYILVNDPFPFYNSTYQYNPNLYCDVGAIKSFSAGYLILYSNFISSLNYNESYYDFRKL